jgi:hypothetical protein
MPAGLDWVRLCRVKAAPGGGVGAGIVSPDPGGERALHVGTRTESARAGEHDGPHRRVTVSGADRIGELPGYGGRPGIEPVRPMQGQQ